MSIASSLNPFAGRVWAALSAEYPQWSEYLSVCGEGDLEVAVPAPPGSQAGHLVVFTSDGKDLWIRFSPPQMCFALADEKEMLKVIRELQTDSALFVVIMQGDEWVQTTLIKSADRPQLGPNEVAHIVSWSGRCDCSIDTRALH